MKLHLVDGGISALAVSTVGFSVPGASTVPANLLLLAAIATFVAVSIVSRSMRMHEPKVVFDNMGVLSRGAVLSTFVAGGIYLGWSWFVESSSVWPSLFAGATLFAGIVLVRRMVRYQLASSIPAVPAIVVGARSQVVDVAEALAECRYPRLVVIGRLDQVQATGAGRESEVEAEVDLLGLPHDASALCAEFGVSEVVSCAEGGEVDATQRRRLESVGVRVRCVEEALADEIDRLPPGLVSEAFVLGLPERPFGKTQWALKRGIDITLALAGLVAWTLLAPVILIAVKLESPGPFLFSQLRVGEDGRLFTIYKVRTMTHGPAAERWAASNDQRITRFGLFLRKTRLDEFPQLWNVLRGEMSVVGPRPEQPSLTEEISQRVPLFKERLRARPGLTGWAQVHQGYAASVEESAVKLSYDLYYLRRASLLLDLDIMFRTIFVMLGRVGAR